MTSVIIIGTGEKKKPKKPRTQYLKTTHMQQVHLKALWLSLHTVKILHIRF